MYTSAMTKKQQHILCLLRSKIIGAAIGFALILAFSCWGGAGDEKLLTEARKAITGADPIMGDWQGSWTLDDGTDSGPLIGQVIAMGKGRYRANLHGEFNYRWPPLVTLEGQLNEGIAQFNGRAEFEGNSLKVRSTIKADQLTGKFEGLDADGQEIAGSFTLRKVIRLSPTLDVKPPDGAIVLFNGKNFDEFKHIRKRRGVDTVQWRLLDDGAMEVRPGSGSIITKKAFTDFKLHLEFRTPFTPEARGQGRGNSGVYLQGRYEVQILDSYGLEGLDNECGGIYTVARPRVNMCAPPTQWQTYDITFRAPRFDENGEKAEEACLTVLHNGVTIHDNVRAPKPTVAAPYNTETGPGGIYLQDHGNPVQYRNIWLVQLPEKPSD